VSLSLLYFTGRMHPKDYRKFRLMRLSRIYHYGGLATAWYAGVREILPSMAFPNVCYIYTVEHVMSSGESVQLKMSKGRPKRNFAQKSGRF
jgi:hypothetical protein